MNISIHFCELNKDKVDELWADQDLSGFKVIAGDSEFDIQDGLQKTEQEQVLAEIIKKDIEFINQTTRSKFSEVLNFRNEEILVWLFQAGLGVLIEDEDFFINNAVTGIPLSLWVQLFQQMPAQAMDKVKDKCKNRNYSFDKFRDHLLGVKSVVKFCLDNHSQMIAYYDGGTSDVMRERAMRIYKRIHPETITAV